MESDDFQQRVLAGLEAIRSELRQARLGTVRITRAGVPHGPVGAVVELPRLIADSLIGNGAAAPLESVQ